MTLVTSVMRRHLAASEGSYKVTEWLLEEGVDVNALDRFKRTPLEDAVRGDFTDLSKLLLDHGGRVWDNNKVRHVLSCQTR